MRLLKRSSPVPAVRGRYHLNTNDILSSRNLDYLKKKLVICLASSLLLKCKQNYNNTIWYPTRMILIIILKKELTAISIGKLGGILHFWWEYTTMYPRPTTFRWFLTEFTVSSPWLNNSTSVYAPQTECAYSYIYCTHILKTALFINPREEIIQIDEWIKKMC